MGGEPLSANFHVVERDGTTAVHAQLHTHHSADCESGITGRTRMLNHDRGHAQYVQTDLRWKKAMGSRSPRTMQLHYGSVRHQVFCYRRYCRVASTWRRRLWLGRLFTSESRIVGILPLVFSWPPCASLQRPNLGMIQCLQAVSFFVQTMCFLFFVRG